MKPDAPFLHGDAITLRDETGRDLDIVKIHLMEALEVHRAVRYNTEFGCKCQSMSDLLKAEFHYIEKAHRELKIIAEKELLPGMKIEDVQPFELPSA